MDAIILQLSTGELCLHTINVLSISNYGDKHFFVFIYSGYLMLVAGTFWGSLRSYIWQMNVENARVEEMLTVVLAPCVTDEQVNVTKRIWFKNHPVKCEQTLTLIFCLCDSALTAARRKKFQLRGETESKDWTMNRWDPGKYRSKHRLLPLLLKGWRRMPLGPEMCRKTVTVSCSSCLSPTFSLSFYCSCLPQQ